MRYSFAISPDVHARDLTSWFILNTRLQRITGETFRATLYDDFAELHAAVDAGRVDLIFANAADTGRLVRSAGYRPIARPRDVADEAAVVVPSAGPLRTLDDVHLDDLDGTLSVAATNAPDVERICRILLEPTDLARDDIRITIKRNYVLVAKAVLTGETRAGFFLRAAYDALSDVTRSGLHVLISSRIYVVRHCLLAGPAIAGLVEPIQAGLQAMRGDPAAQDVLDGLGAPSGWQPMSLDEVEFMTDLVDALEQQ